MKILIINVVCGIRSTGRICAEAAKKLEAAGNEVRIAYGRGQVPEEYSKYAHRIGNNLDLMSHVLKARLFDASGFGSKSATRKFLKWADNYDPDFLWLHNLHGYYINVEELFRWIRKRPQMKVKWTLHDCWAFTGHCTHYMVSKCNKWQYCKKSCCQKNSDSDIENSRIGIDTVHEASERCENCPELKRYPKSWFTDHSRLNYEKKRHLFTDIPNLELITPSQWLADEVKKSFLREYPVTVAYNTIDTDIFRPTPSDFRERYGIGDKILLLGVASKWTDRKGLRDFIKLSHMLDKRYCIFLIGLSRGQLRKIPASGACSYANQTHSSFGCAQFIGIERTNSKKELAEAYTAADYYLNLTYEDNYPTVNLEAEACGTDVITYDVGGCRETIMKDRSEIVTVGDLDAVMRRIKK